MTLDRRKFLAACSQAGVASALLPGALYTLAAQAQDGEKKSEPAKITPELLDQAAALAGITLTADQKKMMLDGLNDQRGSYEAIRALKLPNSVAPAYIFDPLPPGAKIDTAKKEPRFSEPPTVVSPANIEELAFISVRQQAELIRTRKITSLALTQMYLARLKRYDDKLH